MSVDILLDGQIVTLTSEDWAAQSPPHEPEPPFTVFKADIWRRCTDLEAVKLDEALSAQPLRLRRMYADAQFLRSDDELFALLQSATTELLGADRAAVILAPSAA